MKTMKEINERIRLRKIEIARFPTVEKIRIIATRNIFLGFDNDGKSVNGMLGDEFSVPEDLSRDSATKLLTGGFAEPADDAAESKKVLPPPTKNKDRHKLKPVEIRITSGGARKKKFFLGRNDDGEILIGRVGDVLSVPEDIGETLAQKLISKGYATEHNPSLLKKLIG